MVESRSHIEKHVYNLFSVSDKERVVNLGELLGKINSGSGALIGLKEDKRNKINPGTVCQYF